MSGLVFCGDSAWPAPDCLDIGELRRAFAGKSLVLNLEGPILEQPAAEVPVHSNFKFNLYSHPQLVEVARSLGVVACSLANNHITDYVGGMASTIRQLDAAGIDRFGASDRPWIVLTTGGQRSVLLGVCAELTERRPAGPGEPEAARFDPTRALDTIARLRREHADARLVCFVHWGYELALFPEPADREWAHMAIDAGADAVIGHHPHVIQGVELYREAPIVYSLGNFLLPQTRFNDRELKFFSDRVLDQLAVELDGTDMLLHRLRYDRASARVSAMAPVREAADDPLLAASSRFAGMGTLDYRRWFAREGAAARDTRRRAGPVFWSYRDWYGMEAALKLRYMHSKRTVRKLAMRLGVHRPYNW